MVAKKKGGGVLHLVFTAGEGGFSACRSVCTAGDAVLFIDDGVRQLLSGEPGKLLPPGVAIHYAGPDLQARGLLATAETAQVRILQDAAFPALLESHDHCLGWK